MFGFGSKKESPTRRAFLEEFETTSEALLNGPHSLQIAVGYAINLANSFFVKEFGGLEGFKSAGSTVQRAYIAKLTEVEVKLRDAKIDDASSLGFGLFKMWLGAVMANDQELIDKFARTLARFSRTGDIP